MPRPGPRPFECILRAWHSDTHQPLRGTLIHEIFRIVNELHSTSTRRKKEWQDKLPIVVLRAEEILYSKANSEDEYADVATLRSRLDDAVNTMIRRDDSEKEGAYLVPCVEAALSLGCGPKKGSRVQRQGGSRHHVNAARRTATTARPATNEDGHAVTMSIDSDHACHDKHSNSTFSLMSTQVLPVQEQDFRLVALPSNSHLFRPIGALWGPSGPNTGVVRPQNLSFHKFPGFSHPSGVSSFPKPRPLVPFLSPDACKSSGCLCSDVYYALPQACINFKQGLRPLQLLDSAASSGTKMGSRLPCVDGSRCVRSNSPPCTISSLSRDGSRESCIAADHQYKPSLGAVIASSLDSVSCMMVQNALPSSADGLLNSQLKESLSLPGSLTSNLCKSYRTAISRQKFTEVSSTMDDTSTSPSDVHDLQLRLGPPLNEAIGTADVTSAPKRMKVAASSALHIQFL